MPATVVLQFRDRDGSVPVHEWLEDQAVPLRAKCLARITLLGEKGCELDMPIVKTLEPGLFSLRIKHDRNNYRILFSFSGKNVAVLLHGLYKTDVIPERDIKTAKTRRELVKQNPSKYTAIFEINN